jgi:anaerobic selenocysteine-containing dehydrogenase
MTTSSEPILVHGACPHDCPDTCAVITEVQDGKAIKFYADKNHPITQGWLCAKVRNYLDRVYHPDRLTHPLRRTGPKGSDQWTQISWDEAIAEIADNWKRIIAEYGAAAILPYSYSGTLGLVEGLVASSRLWNRMGVSGLQRSICDAAAQTAVEATIGARWAPDMRDVAHSKLVLIWGHNPASTSPHFLPFLRDAQHNGTYVVVVDPRRTLTARSADLHIQPKPATDAALALGMINVIFATGLHDEAWLEANSIGWRELRDRAANYPPDRVEAITGVPAETIVDLARRFATTKPALLKIADGVQRHGNGGQTVRALISLPAVTGQYGVKGGGLFYSASGHVPWGDDIVGHVDDCPPPPRVINMNRLGAALTGEVDDPPIKSLYVFAANPVTSTPNSSLINEGMLRDDLFTVVHEQFMTDSARYADIVLPATTQLEQTDLHRPYGHLHLQYNHQAIAPLGEAKSNWTVMQILATAMGYDEPWLHQSNEEAIAEIFEATKQRNSRLSQMALDELKAKGTAPYSFKPGAEVPFANLRFPTPSGKVELFCERMKAFGVDPIPDYVPPAEFESSNLESPLRLISGAAHHFVSSSLANQPKLMAKEGSPSVEINPEDAAERRIVDGQSVSVTNGRGSIQLRAIVTDDVPPGTAVAPKGQWARFSADGKNINYLTSDRLADLGGQSTFHSNLVEIRPAIADPDHDQVDARSRFATLVAGE